jgi:hypothetical protein
MIFEVALLALTQVDGGVLEPTPIEPRASAATADAGPAAIANLTLNATIDPAVATFGEPFALVLTIVREHGVRLQMPGSLPDIEGAPRVQRGRATTGAPAEVRTAEELPNGRIQETIRVAYLALDTVDLHTPAFSLTTKDGLAVEVPSLNVKVEVSPEPPDGGPAVTEEGALVLAPAAGSIAYAVNDTRPWVALAAVGSAGALYAMARALAKRRRARPQAIPVVPPRPAHEVALERLEALLKSGLLARGETGTFVERLMDEVLRDYLTARFALSAGTRTTRELVQDLLEVSVPGLDIALVESLLADTDLVKFAKATIATERAHAMAMRVRALIEATRVYETAA